MYKTRHVLVPLGDDFRYTTHAECENQFTNHQTLHDFINSHTGDFNVEVHFATLKDYFTAVRQEQTLGRVNFPILSGNFFTYADKEVPVALARSLVCFPPRSLAAADPGDLPAEWSALFGALRRATIRASRRDRRHSDPQRRPRPPRRLPCRCHCRRRPTSGAVTSCRARSTRR